MQCWPPGGGSWSRCRTHWWKRRLALLRCWT